MMSSVYDVYYFWCMLLMSVVFIILHCIDLTILYCWWDKCPYLVEQWSLFFYQKTLAIEWNWISMQMYILSENWRSSVVQDLWGLFTDYGGNWIQYSSMFSLAVAVWVFVQVLRTSSHSPKTTLVRISDYRQCMYVCFHLCLFTRKCCCHLTLSLL